MVKKIDTLDGKTKSEKVYEFLRAKILAAEYKPGDRLIIRKIARQLEVSDIPVREAIKKLTADGLLEIKSHSGARIAPFNIKNLEEMFLIRLELEPLATRLAAKSATNEEIMLLENLVLEMEQHLKNNDIEEYTHTNREFHKQLYRSSHAPVLIEIIENLYLRSENSKSIFQHDPDRLLASNEEHLAIVNALKNKDEENASKLIFAQKEHGFKVVLNALKVSSQFWGEN
ncbi:GntR family transcriptional regulator [Psychrobacillus sp. OK032]|uniref:GntR family transcriptional regulator n=1 Tax=Psychrobacillus sp. OK032 TaxID=1884358 RepID=UPI0008C99A16|nr:GntR family transcriptional regulator [Psychrobacillus sp. OK032]SES18768.1 transcriptional regulator, GntR family [Psychrobacillus sp. OK032]